MGDTKSMFINGDTQMWMEGLPTWHDTDSNNNNSRIICLQCIGKILTPKKEERINSSWESDWMNL